jgi:hypothetical protein
MKRSYDVVETDFDELVLARSHDVVQPVPRTGADAGKTG